jgi:C4-dicarboxylate-specific signal transduction histidine kinase
MQVADILGADFFEHKIRPFLDRCFAGVDTRFEEWFDTALGRRFLAVSYSPLRSGSQRVEAALVISRDLTEHVEASEALRQTQADLAHANRLTTMGELTATLAHEVNQPIAAASTCASTCVLWLTRDDPNVAEARKAAQGAVRNAKRAANIINHIREISRKGKWKRQPVDMNQLIREIISLLRNEAQRYSITIRADLDANLPRVIADSVEVQQVMMNLIMNSIDAMKEVDRTRELAIRSRSGEDRQLIFAVSDTGVGLPQQQMNKIFDAFYTTKAHGIGMGLRISRSIVESHGGRLWAAENSPQGASFYFTLPTETTTEN